MSIDISSRLKDRYFLYNLMFLYIEQTELDFNITVWQNMLGFIIMSQFRKELRKRFRVSLIIFICYLCLSIICTYMKVMSVLFVQYTALQYSSA